MGSWKNWILFMLDAVENTSALTNNLINDILEQMDSTLKYGKSNIKWYTKEVNEAIFSQPYIKPKIIAHVLGRSSRTTLSRDCYLFIGIFFKSMKRYVIIRVFVERANPSGRVLPYVLLQHSSLSY